MCVGYKCPTYIFPRSSNHAEKEKIVTIKRHYEKVTREINSGKVEWAAKHIALAEVSGTEKNRRVQAVNLKIVADHQAEKRSGRNNYRQQNLKNVFSKEESFTHNPKSIESMNCVNYTDNVLGEILYPWIWDSVQPALRAQTGNGVVLLVKDNSATQKALKEIEKIC